MSRAVMGLLYLYLYLSILYIYRRNEICENPYIL
jgi:hypothetical protein